MTRPTYKVTGVWLSPDGEDVAVQFDDGTINIESYGGSSSPWGGLTADTITSTWQRLPM